MMVLGLLVSATIANADRGMPVLVVILMLQLIMCGALVPVYGRPGMEQLAWFVPARWSFAMGAATAEIPPLPGGETDPLWRHSVWSWLLDLVVLSLITGLFALATRYLLQRQKPRRRKAK
jgi:hypothetical protein